VQLYRYFVSHFSEFAATTLCVAYQRVFIVGLYFLLDSVRKLLRTPSYVAEISSLLLIQQLRMIPWLWEIHMRYTSAEMKSILIQYFHITVKIK